MEEEKLLRILIKKLFFCFLITGFMCFVSCSFAFAASSSQDLDTQNLINKMVSGSRKQAVEDSRRTMEEFWARSGFSVSQIGENSITHETSPELLVFVSTSMPESLLEAYYKEAALYGATLVFKGLPGGSFKELSLLIHRLSAGLSEGPTLPGSIIDDESFDKFGVNRVPTIVLKQEKECFLEEECYITYDKLVGNIGIRGALNQFMESGDLKSVAANFIQDASQKDAGRYK